MANRVEALPRLAECEAELLVVLNRAFKVVDEKLWSEGCDARLRGGRSHRSPPFISLGVRAPATAPQTCARIRTLSFGRTVTSCTGTTVWPGSSDSRQRCANVARISLASIIAKPFPMQ